MQKKYILAMDQGTTSSRSLIFDRQGRVVAAARRELSQIYPAPGLVEHDPLEILGTQLATARDAVAAAGISFSDIAAVGVTNQRETCIVWDRATGRPVCNAIVWQCRRGAALCERLKGQGAEPELRARTGLKADPYFSASKLAWILENIPGARKGAERGELLFGTVDSFLLWHMTGVHATDWTNASRTMLFDIQKLRWDPELLSLFGVPEAMLPAVYPSVHPFGITKKELFGAEIPVTGIAGDQHAALFGQCCFEPGQVKNTYGTGCFIMMNTGDAPRFGGGGLLTTIGWGLGEKPVYALEGSVFSAGSVLQWLRDGLSLIKSAPEADEIAERTPDTGGVYFVPAFSGLGAPWWDMSARGLICGLTRGTGREHIVRAALESIAFQSADAIRAMEKDAGTPPGVLRADGGASRSDFLMQLQADLLGVPVERPENIETTATGAAFLAGLGAGFWADREELCSLRSVERVFEPQMSEDEREKMLSGWHGAVRRALEG